MKKIVFQPMLKMPFNWGLHISWIGISFSPLWSKHSHAGLSIVGLKYFFSSDGLWAKLNKNKANCI